MVESYRQGRIQGYPELKKSLASLGFNPLDSGASSVEQPTVQPLSPEQQAEEAKKQTETFLKTLDIDGVFDSDSPSQASGIITSEDLIKAAELRSGPLARFGPTVLGQLNPILGIAARLGTFLIDKQIEKVLNLRGDEDLLKDWKKGKRKEVIESLTEKARVAEEAVKPVDVTVDIDAAQFAGGDTGVGATAISPQEAASAAVAGGQKIDTSGQGTTPQLTTPTPEAPDIEVPEAPSDFDPTGGIDPSQLKSGGRVNKSLGGLLAKLPRSILQKTSKKPNLPKPKRLVTKDPESVQKEMSELIPETTEDITTITTLSDEVPKDEKQVDELLEATQDIQEDIIKPKKTKKAYKLFRVKDNKLHPLFVDTTTSIPLNKWLKASIGEKTKTGQVKARGQSGLAFRPGWHSGDFPVATHIGGKIDPKTGNRITDRSFKPNVREDNQVWAEVEISDDIDWQTIANSRASIIKSGPNKGKLNSREAHITDQIPEGGNYRYKTNPNMKGNWLISGEIKVNRILTDEQVREINKPTGIQDLPRKHEVVQDTIKGMFIKPKSKPKEKPFEVEYEGGETIMGLNLGDTAEEVAESLNTKLTLKQIAKILDEQGLDYEYNNRDGITIMTEVGRDKVSQKSFKKGTTLKTLLNFLGYSRGGQVQDLRDGGRVRSK
jgi:hypothetical protein